MTTDLKLAIQTAHKAATFIRKNFQQEFRTEEKSDHSLVTSVDREAESIIIDALQKHSNHAILSEESGSLPGSSGFTWVIDPIDGTTNFSRQHLPFAVSIALMGGDESLIGVIQNPLTDECFYAEHKNAAFLNGSPIHVSTNSSPVKSIVFFNYGSDRQDRQRIVKVVNQLIFEFDLRIWGTTAWELCAVAKGTADAFVCVGDKLWDFAAGMCIIKEAGGEFCDWRGEPWKSWHSYVLASNPHIRPLLVERIRNLQNNEGV